MSGLIEGCKGFSEISKGVEGLFMKPYKTVKEEGFKSIFKGLYLGIMTFSLAPIAVHVKFHHSVHTGIKNSLRSDPKRDEMIRFRQPRHIIINEPLKPYDENFAQIQNVLRKLHITDNKFLLTCEINYVDEVNEEEIAKIILTDRRLLVVSLKNEKHFEILLRDIKHSEVHSYKEKFIMVFVNLNDKKSILKTDNASVLLQIQDMLQYEIGR
jgi:hypothetical protein